MLGTGITHLQEEKAQGEKFFFPVYSVEYLQWSCICLFVAGDGLDFCSFVPSHQKFQVHHCEVSRKGLVSRFEIEMNHIMLFFFWIFWD